MKKISSILLFMVFCITGMMLTSCGNDLDNEEESCGNDLDNEEEFSLSGTSWEATDESDSMVGVVLTFMANGDVKLSKPVEGWNNPKWTMTAGKSSNSYETYGLTITMDDGRYLYGDFTITGEYGVINGTPYYGRNYAEYYYGWYEKDQDICYTWVESHMLCLRKK